MHFKIGVLGFSAGGNLTALLTTNFSEIFYNFVDKIDNETCKPDFTLLIYPYYLDLGENNTVSPNLLKEKNLAPIFIFGKKDDPYYNSTNVFSDYLKTINCDFELQTLPKGNHGYGLRKGNNTAETWPVLVEKWLNKFS